jgi:subfamily B ATP-binding cassette protein MsbA
MKTYFRLLSFAKPIEKFAIPYILVTLFAILFNTLNLALLAPLMETLFSDTKAGIADAAVAVKPKSWLDLMV